MISSGLFDWEMAGTDDRWNVRIRMDALMDFSLCSSCGIGGGSGRALPDAHLNRDETAVKMGHPV